MYIAFFLAFLLIIVLLFMILYHFNRIPVNKTSIFSWCIISLELYLFVLGFWALFNLKAPIYIENVSQYSLLRYTIFLIIIMILGISYYIVKAKKPSEVQRIIIKISYPCVKEEIVHILNNVFDKKLYNIANALISNVRNSHKWKITFLVFTFLVYHGMRIVSLTLFVYFVFFHGDLSLLILILPITFTGWVFNYLLYWFEAYIKVNVNKGKEILNVVYKKVHNNSATIYATEDDLELSLTPYGKSLNYEDTQLPELTAQWLMLFHMSYLINNYKLKMQILDKILLGIRIFCWMYISYLLFYPNYA
jgi:hypothetical protein